MNNSNDKQSSLPRLIKSAVAGFIATALLQPLWNLCIQWIQKVFGDLPLSPAAGTLIAAGCILIAAAFCRHHKSKSPGKPPMFYFILMLAGFVAVNLGAAGFFNQFRKPVIYNRTFDRRTFEEDDHFSRPVKTTSRTATLTIRGLGPEAETENSGKLPLMEIEIKSKQNPTPSKTTIEGLAMAEEIGGGSRYYRLKNGDFVLDASFAVGDTLRINWDQTAEFSGEVTITLTGSNR